MAMDQITRGAAHAGVVGLGRREREFSAAYVDSNRVFLRDFLAGLSQEEADAYIAARSREWALSWTRDYDDPAYVKARAEAAAAQARVVELKRAMAEAVAK